MDLGQTYEQLALEAYLAVDEALTRVSITRQLISLSLVGYAVADLGFILDEKWTQSECTEGELSPKTALEAGEVYIHCFLPTETRTDIPDKGLVTFSSKDKSLLWVLRASNEVPWDRTKCCCSDCYPTNGLR